MARKDLAQYNKERMENHLSLALCELDKLERLQATQATATDKALKKINDRISTMEIAHQKEVRAFWEQVVAIGLLTSAKKQQGYHQELKLCL